jgi:hypothetical protein
MKKPAFLLLCLILTIGFNSCKKDSTTTTSTGLSGDPSPMGVVGTTVTSSSYTISGVSEIVASVATLSDGISSYSGSATIENTVIKNMLANYPEFNISGNNVSVFGYKFRQTVEGIECMNAAGPGIIVKYASSVGDTYPVGSTGRTRKVISKSTTDDYFYGGLMIKVMQIEEPTPSLKSIGVSKVTYWANHKFGLVAVKWDITDGSSVTFPVYCSTTN